MTTFYVTAGAPGGGDGSEANPFNALSNIGSQSGDSHTFLLSGDFRDETPGTNGFIEVNGNSWTIKKNPAAATRPYVGLNNTQADVNISTIVLSGGTCTVTTATAHGLKSNATVLIAAVTGGATAANGTWDVTVTNSTVFTFALAGTASETSGTVTHLSSGASGVYCSNFTGLAVEDLTINRVSRGLHMANTYTGFTFRNVALNECGKYHISLAGASTSGLIEQCVLYYAREDGINISGTSNTGWTVKRCRGTYFGYNFGGTTASGISGAGDFVTTHAGTGSSNSGDVLYCEAGYCYGNGIAFTNSTGTSNIHGCHFYECADSGMVQNGGGSANWTACTVIPPSGALTGSSPRAALRVNPSNSTAGTFNIYGCSIYTAYGSISPISGAYACVAVSGTNVAAITNVYGCRFVSNGTAPFVHISNGSSVNVTSITIAAGETTVVTAAVHGLTTGQKVLIAGQSGGTAGANGTWRATVVNTTTFTIALTGSASTGAVGTIALTPDVTFDENVYSAAVSATLFSYGGSKTGTTWQANGFDANGLFGTATFVTVPPTTKTGFAISTASGNLKTVTAVGTPANALYDAVGRRRQDAAGWDAGALQMRGSGSLGAGGGSVLLFD